MFLFLFCVSVFVLSVCERVFVFVCLGLVFVFVCLSTNLPYRYVCMHFYAVVLSPMRHSSNIARATEANMQLLANLRSTSDCPIVAGVIGTSDTAPPKSMPRSSRAKKT